MGSPEPSLPTILGPYALFESIASGRMASVHFGLHVGPGGFSRTIAIKRLHPSVARNPEISAMLADEARLATRIRHRNVVTVTDVLEVKKELLLVMEYIHGESLLKLLETLCARRELAPVRVATTILVDALEGLQAAHEATNQAGEPLHIVHRDISPPNVIVGCDGVARVLDFGIAKAANRLQVTRPKQIKSKLGYVAPEQIQYREEDPRTDLWAASVVLWETLTARRLFDDDDPAQTCNRILKGAVAPPSSLVPGLPPGLDDIVLRGLRVDPAERFESAAQMAQALDALVPRLSPRELGSWVQSVAGSLLERRAARLKEIESYGPELIPTTQSPRSRALPQRQPSEPPPASTAHQRFYLRLAIALCTLVGVGFAIGLLIVLLSPRRTPSYVEPLPSSTESSGSSTPPSLEPPALAPLLRASNSAAPASDSSASRRRPTGSSLPSSNCTPPYAIDARGVRVPKPDCYLPR